MWKQTFDSFILGDRRLNWCKYMNIEQVADVWNPVDIAMRFWARLLGDTIYKLETANFSLAW